MELKKLQICAGDVLKSAVDDIQEKPDFIVIRPAKRWSHQRHCRRLLIMVWTSWCIFPVNLQVGEDLECFGERISGGEGLLCGSILSDSFMWRLVCCYKDEL